MISTIFGLLSATIALAAFLPYGLDIRRGRVRPARATRIMLTLIMLLVLWQQLSLGAGWALAVTAGEVIGSIAILVLSFKRGIGGWQRSDTWCYGLLALSMSAWLATGSALLALHISVVADIIACVPTFIKTWRLPHTETPLFYVMGIAAPILSILALGRLSYATALFPVYLVLVNGVQLGLMYRPKRPLPVNDRLEA